LQSHQEPFKAADVEAQCIAENVIFGSAALLTQMRRILSELSEWKSLRPQCHSSPQKQFCTIALETQIEGVRVLST
jgi:hypothetical protein